MRVFGLMRVKNEARWIERVVNSITPVCERVLVLDDHSEDGTAEICERLGCTVYRSEFAGVQEARDKDYLLSKLWEAGAQVTDWCLMIDGDEELVDLDRDALIGLTQRPPNAWGLRVLYLWNSDDEVRVDGVYRTFCRPSFFRLTHTGLSFKRTTFGGQFHCSNVPSEFIERCRMSSVRLAHYGYMSSVDRIRKYHWYNTIDPNNEVEDCYRHTVIGDLFPADSTFRWGGPLQLIPASEA